MIFANAINMVEESRFYTVAQHCRDFLKLYGVLYIAEGCAGRFSAWNVAKLFPVNLLCSLWHKNLS